MKFSCTQIDLNAHLSLVSRAVSSRPSKPVLGNVLIEAEPSLQQVTLIGFDETLGIQTAFPAEVERGGKLTVPAKLLGDIVSRLPNETIEVSESESEPVVTLDCSSGQYRVRGIEADDYPNLPLVEAGEAASLSAEALLEGLRGSLFATSGDETKQVLTGVHLATNTDSLEFAATDGHRLAVVQTVDADSRAASNRLDMRVTIPAKALRELERMLQMYQETEPVTLRFDDTQVVFELGQQRITTRLLEGQYPDYQRLIPHQFTRQLTLDRKQLLSSLERIAVMADQRNNIVKLTLISGDQSLALSVEAQEVGSGRERLPAQVTGEDLEIAFNVRYLLDGLKALPSTEVQLQCNTATSPSILTPLSGSKMTYLVMPVQIRS
ncbi:DNA polymerase III subunit beta [Romeria aff. gracilis LEGE 07310]|uniref:Beta sliding clamp n=1 Tax=Vasconcelosia minhoensis LEGE 07310 TaxID=915328 RepID=A0A8J7DMP4_9CYAN|nr:DNA polymerase III subunit beta [Romeria gracilis]MBE9077075.1 DNA polymerase III subunit beta [Romeria aff. gracilis LEGE 07310]